MAELRRRHTERPASVWRLVYDGFDPARQGLREALCAVGNEYFVTRGACPRREPTKTAPGHLCRRPLQPGQHRDRRAHGRERGPGQRAQRRSASGWPTAPGSTSSKPGVLDHRLELNLRQGTHHPVPAVAGPGRPPHQRGPAPPGQPQGPAPGRPGDDLHGRELVGDNPGPLQAWRPGSRRCQAVRQPERPPPGGAARRRADAGAIELQVETNQSHVLVALAARTRLLRDGGPSRPTGGWSPSPGSSPTS